MLAFLFGIKPAAAPALSDAERDVAENLKARQTIAAIYRGMKMSECTHLAVDRVQGRTYRIAITGNWHMPNCPSPTVWSEFEFTGRGSTDGVIRAMLDRLSKEKARTIRQAVAGVVGAAFGAESSTVIWRSHEPMATGVAVPAYSCSQCGEMTIVGAACSKCGGAYKAEIK
jgi:ribosomal protein L32